MLKPKGKSNPKIVPLNKICFAYISYLILSGVAIYCAPHLREIMDGLAFLSAMINGYLEPLFSGAGLGTHLSMIIALMVTPMLFVIPIALLYQRLKHKPMPYQLRMAWLLWLVTVLSYMTQQGL